MTERPDTSTASGDAPSDAVLVARARAGDGAAWTVIHARYGRVVHGVMLACGVRTEAEDLTQEVFVSAMRSLHALNDAGALGGWLVASARNRAASWLRARRPAQTAEAAQRLEVARGPMRAEGTFDTETAMRAIMALPEAYRETLVLRLVEGLTGPQIAAATGLTHGSVRVNLSKGMEMLRERLAVMGVTP